MSLLVVLGWTASDIYTSPRLGRRILIPWAMPGCNGVVYAAVKAEDGLDSNNRILS